MLEILHFFGKVYGVLGFLLSGLKTVAELARFK